MAQYTLYCFAESGNAYKAALMLALAQQDWQAKWVDFFHGETRTDAYRKDVNEMGEVPVLLHGGERLTQSGVILHYLAEQTGRFSSHDPATRREILRWMFFDNHKFTSYIATLRFLLTFMKSGETEITNFMRGRAEGALDIVNKHLAGQDYLVGNELTIADLSMCGYLYYGDELGLSLAPYDFIEAWLGRIRSQPGWQAPYDLMPKAAG